MKNNMKPITSTYNEIFTKIILALLLGVMWLSLKQGYEHISDNLYKKDWLIEHYNRLRLTIGDKVFSPSVVVGNNNWLEFSNDYNIDDYQNVIPLSAQQLDKLKADLGEINTIGEENHIQFVIVIAPNKATIYPDRLPSQIKPIGQISRLDQILEFAPLFSNIQFIDLRPALLKARQQQEIYYQTDTHWNNFGAYIAYSEIIKTLSEKYPNLQIYPYSSLQTTEAPHDGDLARMLRAPYLNQSEKRLSFSLESLQSIDIPQTLSLNQITWQTNITLPTALIYHDSFGYAGLNRFLSSSFSEATFIHYLGEEYVNLNTIKKFQPDIVVIEVIERDIGNLENILPPMSKNN